MRLLKHAWDTADLDSDGALTEAEMRKTARSLLRVTKAEFPRFWELMSPAADSVELSYLEFLNGMATAAADDEFRDRFAALRPNQLITVLVDIPVMQKEEKMMLASLSRVERIGVGM